jgi:ligand-binding sensor domain-containing protein
MNIKIGISGFLLCCVHFLFGQNEDFRFSSLGIKEGLSQSTVFSIFQDRKGFLWISTADGLNQFDGYKFTVYKNNHLDPNSLSDNWVFDVLLEDSENELWLVTADGVINKLNLGTKEITRFTFGKTDTTSSRFEQLYYILEDSHKNIAVRAVILYSGR